MRGEVKGKNKSATRGKAINRINLIITPLLPRTYSYSSFRLGEILYLLLLWDSKHSYTGKQNFLRELQLAVRASRASLTRGLFVMMKEYLSFSESKMHSGVE